VEPRTVMHCEAFATAATLATRSGTAVRRFAVCRGLARRYGDCYCDWPAPVDGEIGIHSNRISHDIDLWNLRCRGRGRQAARSEHRADGDRPRTCSELHQRRAGGGGRMPRGRNRLFSRASTHRPVVAAAGGLALARGYPVCSGHDRRSPWPLPLTRLGQRPGRASDRR